MSQQVLRKLFLGFIQVHILHHGHEKPFYGSWMIRELQEHGYEVSPGTLYPILQGLENEGLLSREVRNVNGRIRKYYSTTAQGLKVLEAARQKIGELVGEIQH